MVIPPANLTNLPMTKSFTLKNLQPHLQPQKIELIKEDHGPFLFTPINFGSLERKTTSKSKMGERFFIKFNRLMVFIEQNKTTSNLHIVEKIRGIGKDQLLHEFW